MGWDGMVADGVLTTESCTSHPKAGKGLLSPSRNTKDQAPGTPEN